jgi:hypothetical protein
MGMFDTIKCEVTLPITKKIAKNFKDKNWTEVSFQTKDLDCILSTYIIKKNNTLLHKIERNKWIPRKKEKGFRGFLDRVRKDKWRSPYQIIHTGTTYKKFKHTGIINFYCIQNDINDNEWDLEFDAKFVDGIMTSLKLKSAKIWRTSREIKKDDNDFRKMLETHEKHLPNKIRRFLNKVTFGYWRWFWSKIATTISGTGNKIGFFIQKHL